MSEGSFGAGLQVLYSRGWEGFFFAGSEGCVDPRRMCYQGIKTRTPKVAPLKVSRFPCMYA